MTMLPRRRFLRSAASAGLLATTAPVVAQAANCPPAHGLTEARFRAYIDAFNKNNYADFGDYYAEDVVLVIAGKTELQGRQAIFDFYKTVKSQTQRTIEINKLIITDTHLAAELQSEFLALEDVPDFTAGPMKKGGRIFINTFVLYDLTPEGRFQRIRSAEFNKIDRQVQGSDA